MENLDPHQEQHCILIHDANQGLCVLLAQFVEHHMLVAAGHEMQ